MPLLLNCCISKFLTNQLPKIFIMNFSSRNFGDGIMSALSSRNDHHKLWQILMKVCGVVIMYVQVDLSKQTIIQYEEN
jgi:hypothetical protein